MMLEIHDGHINRLADGGLTTMEKQLVQLLHALTTHHFSVIPISHLSWCILLVSLNFSPENTLLLVPSTTGLASYPVSSCSSPFCVAIPDSTPFLDTTTIRPPH